MGALPSQQAAAWPLPSASSGCGRLSGAQLVASLLLGSSAATDGLSQQGESSPGSQQPLVSRRPCSLSLLLFPWPLAFLVLSKTPFSFEIHRGGLPEPVIWSRTALGGQQGVGSLVSRGCVGWR